MQNSKRIKPEQLTELKNEGNQAFGKGDYNRAIAYYKQGLQSVEAYRLQTEGTLPYWHDIGESPKLEPGMMYLQDFSRLKATFLNNLSSCLFNKNQIDQADKFNDLALMEDPGYQRAHWRKCLILEQRGEFKAALNLAEATLEDLNSEYNTDEASKKIIPKLEELTQRLEIIKDQETEFKKQRMQKEVEEELGGAQEDPGFDKLFADLRKEDSDE